MLKKLIDLFFLLLIVLGLSGIVGCASGGGSAGLVIEPTTTPNPPPTSNTETDERIHFEEFSYNFDTIYGDVTWTYGMSEYTASSTLPSNDKYKIADYGFLQVTGIGKHDPCSSAVSDVCDDQSGPWGNGGFWFEADLNGDEWADLIYVGNTGGSYEWIPPGHMLAFINEEGHFRLASELFENNEFPCVWGNGHMSEKTNPHDPCGFQNEHTNGKIVADFNGDGISDYYDTSILYLSDNGVLKNKSFTNLPDLFFNAEDYGPIFVHDAYAGHLDNNDSLDIFLPIFDVTNYGVLWGGGVDPCSGCNQAIPWVMLMNDGTGNFTANHNINMPGAIQVGDRNVRLWATTAAIGDFDNDGHGDIAVGWYNPSESEHYGYSQYSSGLVYFNDGTNDWRNRSTIELPANYFGANGNANDMEVIDFNGDGFLDILLASTIHDPYYKARVIQFFMNNNGESFTDVSATWHPAYENYANGNPNGSNFGVGQGQIRILDFDHDGDLDIVDINANTYVLINEGDQFVWYQEWVDMDEDYLLFPVEIDNKYQYDFIGSTSNCTEDRCITDFFQVLDPPFVQMMQEIATKPKGYINAIYDTKLLLDDVRKFTRGNNIGYKRNKFSSLLGYSFSGEENGFFIGSLNGDSNGGILGWDSQDGNIHTGFYYLQNTLTANNITKWYGTGTADVKYNSITSFTEVTNAINTNLFYTLGSTITNTHVESFIERDSNVNVNVDSFNMWDASVFADLDYIYNSRFGTTHLGISGEYIFNLHNVEIDFGNALTYEFNKELLVGEVSLSHTYKVFYVTYSKNTEDLESFELGFNLRF